MEQPPVVYALEPAHALAGGLVERCGFAAGTIEQRRFPDGESYVRLAGDVDGRTVVLVATLDHPDEHVPALVLAAATCRELGARRVVLVAPYLPYMRQDRRFRDGEAIAARVFVTLLSSYVDALVTVAPHLHRIADLSDVCPVPSFVASADGAIAAWISRNIAAPILVGPDEESAQWVSAVAEGCSAPWTCLRKERSGDRRVAIERPVGFSLQGRTPVLVDDIVSTATTMAHAVRLLREDGASAPVCVAIHALFAEGAAEALVEAGAGRIVTCDTVAHATNAITVLPGLAEAVGRAACGSRLPPRSG